jgi:hypothetical protein
MKLSKDLRRGRNCVFLMHVHLVFVARSILNDLRDTPAYKKLYGKGAFGLLVILQELAEEFLL